jgi:hypothetical protein
MGATTLERAATQSYALLRLIFVVAPLAFGIDKFSDWMTDWPKYLAPWVNDLMPGTGAQFMHFVGVVEIVAALLVLVIPRIGAPVVAAWLAGIVVNLLTVDPPTYYDVALRDVGLLAAALVLTRLAWAVHAAKADRA